MNRLDVRIAGVPDREKRFGQRPGRRSLDLSRVGLRGWLIAFALDAALVVLCYRWVDQPVARLMHHTVAYNPFWHLLTHLPDLLTLASFAWLIALPLLAWRAGGVRKLREMAHLGGVLLAGASFVLSAAIKSLLKIGFGRTWPETWYHGNPSLIRDGVYGFHPFAGGAAYASFPSGHMTGVMSVVVIGWQLWPKLAPWWAAAAIGAAAGLIGMNFHFVSDVVAGTYLGAVCAAGVLWVAGERRS